MSVRANLKNCLVMAMFLIAMGCATAAGRTIYVDDDGPADFNNIQAAIDDSNDGDTVIIADGTYTGDGNRDIDFLGKAITLRSENGPENCVIDCNGPEEQPHRGFYFHSSEDANSVLDGFTITKGYTEYGGGIGCFSSSPTISNCIILGNRATYGGGICCYDNSRPMISYCTIMGNSAANGGGISCAFSSSPIIKNCTIVNNSGFGGGIYCVYSSPKITNCVISKNVAPCSGNFCAEGGGIMCELSSPAIRNCVISNNSAGRGGAASFYSSDPVMANCTVSYNSADDCGGVFCFRSNLTIENCTLSGNSATYYGGGLCNCSGSITNCTITGNKGGYGGGGLRNCSSPITNCIIWDNLPEQLSGCGSVTYSNVQGGWAGAGNFDAVPSFATSGYWDPNATPDDANDDFWVNGDYHLKSQAGRWDANEGRWMKDDVTSPCIDGGDMASPIGLEPFPNGGIINMGAYGGTAEASKSYFGEPPCEIIVAGDINGDCIVNFDDFALMALHWLQDENQ